MTVMSFVPSRRSFLISKNPPGAYLMCGVFSIWGMDNPSGGIVLPPISHPSLSEVAPPELFGGGLLRVWVQWDSGVVPFYRG